MKTLLIPQPALFSFEECSWFLNRNYDDCLHHITPGKLSKAITINGEDTAFTLQADDHHLQLQITAGGIHPDTPGHLERYINDWLDLERDIAPFYKLLEKNPSLHYMVKEFAGFRLIGIPDLYEALCWSIIGQQINLSFAYTLKRRLVERYGSSLLVDDQPLYLFPQPAILQQATVADLRNLQFSGRKAEYLISIAGLFASGAISKPQLQQYATYEEQVQALTAIRGIGVWTANYALMKSLKQLNAIPYGDVGLLNALINHQLIRDKKDTEGIYRLFLQFKGWESYLVFYLWRSLASPA